MTAHPYALLDVFTDQPLSGNQLAVFTAAELLPRSLLQPLARELNLSETVFVLPPEAGGNAKVRYFSTVTELPFAGHPTLGTACLLAADRVAGEESVVVRLETGRGIVPVRVRATESGGFVGWMSQPIPTIEPWPQVRELCAVLEVDDPVLPVEVYDNGIAHLFVVLDTVEQVEAIVPDFGALGRVCGEAIRINVAAGSGAAYTSRMFSPFDYVPEDPACGSAAGPLALHLYRHGCLGPDEVLTISQGAHVRRPSTLYARIDADDHLREIHVGGGARIVGRGTFDL